MIDDCRLEVGRVNRWGVLVLAKAAGLDDPELFAEFAFGQCATEGSHHGEQIGVRRFGRKT